MYGMKKGDFVLKPWLVTHGTIYTRHSLSESLVAVVSVREDPYVPVVKFSYGIWDIKTSSYKNGIASSLEEAIKIADQTALDYGYKLTNDKHRCML